MPTIGKGNTDILTRDLDYGADDGWWDEAAGIISFSFLKDDVANQLIDDAANKLKALD